MKGLTVLITGATGMIGDIILAKCLKDDRISSVLSLGRRSLGIQHEKLQELLDTDFLNLTKQESLFKNVDVVYFCLGVYTGQVSKEQFKIITFDYVKAFADGLIEHSPECNFCLLSGAGADSKEQSRVAFARYKGMAENHVLQLGFAGVNIFRPGYIYPVEKRKEPNFMYRMMRTIYPIFKPIMSKSSISSTDLGQAMFNAGFDSSSNNIFENVDIVKLLK